MGTRANALASKLEQTIGELLAAVEASTPDQWSSKCSDGEWTQSFAAFHAAINIEPTARTVHGIAGGQPFPQTAMEAIDEGNAMQATEHAECTKAETIDLIRSSASGASEMVRSLTDDQLDRRVQPPQGMPET